MSKKVTVFCAAPVNSATMDALKSIHGADVQVKPDPPFNGDVRGMANWVNRHADESEMCYVDGGDLPLSALCSTENTYRMFIFSGRVLTSGMKEVARVVEVHGDNSCPVWENNDRETGQLMEQRPMPLREELMSRAD